MIDKKSCCGCRSCEQSCPQKCIQMVIDNEGFLYPKIDEKKCTHCDLCSNVCPFQSTIKQKKDYEQSCFLAVHNDSNMLKGSSSGGDFTAIANAFCDNEYYISGCIIDESLKVKHTFTDKLSEINMFRKSKYVQSELNDTFKNIKLFLSQNKNVLFSGTPCQVAGLKTFLGKDYDNLLTIDILCHGVPSQKMFDLFINDCEKKYKDRVKTIDFRCRSNILFAKDPYCMEISLNSGKKIKEFSFENSYMRGFFKKIFYRPCCETCPFATVNRVSDITIGDFWGADKIDKKLNASNGISLMLVNTLKGSVILDKARNYLEIKEADIDIAIENNTNLSKPSKFCSDRSEFFKRLDTENFSDLINIYTKMGNRIIWVLQSIIPVNIQKIIKRFVRKTK